MAPCTQLLDLKAENGFFARQSIVCMKTIDGICNFPIIRWFQGSRLVIEATGRVVCTQTSEDLHTRALVSSTSMTSSIWNLRSRTRGHCVCDFIQQYKFCMHRVWDALKYHQIIRILTTKMVHISYHLLQSQRLFHSSHYTMTVSRVVHTPSRINQLCHSDPKSEVFLNFIIALWYLSEKDISDKIHSLNTRFDGSNHWSGKTLYYVSSFQTEGFCLLWGKLKLEKEIIPHLGWFKLEWHTETKQWVFALNVEIYSIFHKTLSVYVIYIQKSIRDFYKERYWLALNL